MAPVTNIRYELLLKHLEDHHNVFEEQELVLSLQFAYREVKDILLKKTKKRIENEIGLDNDDSGGEDNEEGGELPRFNYPKFDRKPGSKNWTLTYLRKQVSTFLSVQGYGRNKKRLAEGARPIGWPEDQYPWFGFKGTGRACSKMMLQDILFALLAAQDVDPKEHVEEQLEDNFEESNEQHIEEHPNVEQTEEQEQVEGEDQIDDPGDFAEDTRKARQDSLERKLKRAVIELENEDNEITSEEDQDHSDVEGEAPTVKKTRKSTRAKKPNRKFFGWAR